MSMISNARTLMLGVLMVTGGLVAGVARADDAPAVGDLAPDFTLPGSDGETHTLSDLRGQYVVIAFFPKAYTGG